MKNAKSYHLHLLRAEVGRDHVREQSSESVNLVIQLLTAGEVNVVDILTKRRNFLAQGTTNL